MSAGPERHHEGRYREAQRGVQRMIANAVEHATGARVTRLPITAVRVARARGLVTE